MASGPRGFSVTHYDLSSVDGASLVTDSGVVIFTATESGTIETWSTGKPPDPADGGIPVEAGDKVVIKYDGGTYGIQVVPQ